MINRKPLRLSLSAHSPIVHLLAGFLLLFSLTAQATAPRINAEMFGDEKKAEIVGYQFTPLDDKAKKDGEMMTAIIVEAFKSVGAAPTLDVLPSKQLASYAVTNNDAVGFIGHPGDLSANPKVKYHSIIFAFRGSEPISLILSNNPRGDELYKAFGQGLQQIVKSGKYLELLENYFGKDQVPSDYVTRLKNQNPGWK